jgi:hypothetical protein
MIQNWLTSLKNLAIAIRDFFLAPGDFLLSQLLQHAPLSAARAGVAADADTLVLSAVVSLFFWIIVFFTLWRVTRLCGDVIRNVGAVFLTIRHQVTHLLASWKTRFVIRFRERFPHRQSTGIEAVPEIDFDDLDLAVLRSAVAGGPAFALSAPELAEKFRMRPAQVQKSLEKLRMNRMVDIVIGSTDGFQNYRLTPSGETFVSMWQRQNYPA